MLVKLKLVGRTNWVSWSVGSQAASDQGGACSGLCGPTAGKRWHEMMEQRVVDAWPMLKNTDKCLVMTALFSGPEVFTWVLAALHPGVLHNTRESQPFVRSGAYVSRATREPPREPGNQGDSVESVQGPGQARPRAGSVASFPTVRMSDTLSRGLQQPLVSKTTRQPL